MSESPNINPEVLGLIRVALITDGAHHKQWCIEQIAELLDLDISDLEYEKGIAP